jgi:hypothetical protein
MSCVIDLFCSLLAGFGSFTDPVLLDGIRPGKDQARWLGLWLAMHGIGCIDRRPLLRRLPRHRYWAPARRRITAGIWGSFAAVSLKIWTAPVPFSFLLGFSRALVIYVKNPSPGIERTADARVLPRQLSRWYYWAAPRLHIWGPALSLDGASGWGGFATAFPHVKYRPGGKTLLYEPHGVFPQIDGRGNRACWDCSLRPGRWRGQFLWLRHSRHLCARSVLLTRGSTPR